MLTRNRQLRMQMMGRFVAVALWGLLGVGLVHVIAPSALALTTCGTGTFNGTDVDFLQVQEASSFGDPEPLFCSGPTAVAGNTLTFFPANFSAIAAGGSFDQTGSQLQAEITTTSVMTIDQILITEFGDVVLTGIGTAATGTFVSMAGFVTVLEVLGAPVTPTVIGFLGTFTPSNLTALPGDLGTTLWSGSTLVDVASVVPNATKVQLSFDNDLTAFSEAGTTAKIQKKVGGPINITVIPEPATLALLCGGVLVMGLLRRSRRG
ncbi:MAG: PEP-CTERM sorting domain-containing protein [Myxococcales bacterium]|nr:PEP-CTERM sorting domain-containing protein [Myxococcales bacterium]